MCWRRAQPAWGGGIVGDSFMGKSIPGGITSPFPQTRALGRWQCSAWVAAGASGDSNRAVLAWREWSQGCAVSLHIQLLRATGLSLGRIGKDGWGLGKIWPPRLLEVLCFQSSAVGQAGESSVSLPRSHESKGRRKLNLGCFPGLQPALPSLSSSDTSTCCHLSWLRVAPAEGLRPRHGCRI